MSPVTNRWAHFRPKNAHEIEKFSLEKQWVFSPKTCRLAFPESVRAVVGSICRSGQVLGFGQNERKVKGNVNPTPRFSPSDAETVKMCENTGICIFGICPLCGGVNSPKWTIFY